MRSVVVLVFAGSLAAQNLPEKVTIDLSRFGSIAPGAKVTPVVTTKSPLDDIEKNALVEGAPVAIDTAAKSAFRL